MSDQCKHEFVGCEEDIYVCRRCKKKVKMVEIDCKRIHVSDRHFWELKQQIRSLWTIFMLIEKEWEEEKDEIQ